MENEEIKGFLIKHKGIVKMIMFAIVFFMFLNPVKYIAVGHKGVVMKFGAVSDRVLGEGINFIVPIADSVQEISVQIRKSEYKSQSASKDLQIVETELALNYHLSDVSDRQPVALGALLTQLMTEMSEDYMQSMHTGERIEAHLYAGSVFATQEAAMADAQRLVDDYLTGFEDDDLGELKPEGKVLDWTGTRDGEGRLTLTAVHEVSGYQYAVRQEKVND